MGHLSSRARVGSLGPARNRRWRALGVGIFALFVLLAFGAWGAAGRRGVPARTSRPVLATQQRVARPRSRSLQVGSGAALKRFDVSEPAGVIRLLRVTVPHGTRAKLTGAIPQVAGVAISTPQGTVPSETCQRRGAADICTQAEQACPMPGRDLAFPAAQAGRTGWRDPRGIRGRLTILAWMPPQEP